MKTSHFRDEEAEVPISDISEVTPWGSVMISVLPFPRAVLPPHKKIPAHFLNPLSPLVLRSFSPPPLSPTPTLTNAAFPLRSSSDVASSKAFLSYRHSTLYIPVHHGLSTGLSSKPWAVPYSSLSLTLLQCLANRRHHRSMH